MINPFIYENDKDFKNLSQENVAKIDRWMTEFQEKKNLEFPCRGKSPLRGQEHRHNL